MKKRRINGNFLVLVSLLLIILISIFKIPAYRTIKSLKELGYKEETVEIIRGNKLDKEFIENSTYSKLLEEELLSGDYDPQYFNLYMNRETLTSQDKELYQALLGEYTKEELETLFLNLNYEEIRPLLLFDHLKKLDDYIKDVTKNGIENLKGSYIEPYSNITTISNPKSLDVLVTLNRSLGEYVPELTTLSSLHSVPGVSLEVRTAEAFENELCEAMRKAGVPIYAVSGYVSYEKQKSLFDWYDLEEEAIERGVFKAGFNEKQTGLVVSVVASSNESAKEFCNTEAYTWLKEHAHEYGFIFRYPKEKASITLVEDANQNQLRYLGKELATKVYESGLSYDEYVLYSE